MMTAVLILSRSSIRLRDCSKTTHILLMSIRSMSAVLVVVMERYIVITGGDTYGRIIGESFILDTIEAKQEWKQTNVFLNTLYHDHITVLVVNDYNICIFGKDRNTTIFPFKV